MPYAASGGHGIAFDVEGEGPVVLLQHGLFSRRTSWHANGFVAALAREFTVVTVDSLGHGESDKPSDPHAYRRDARADDLAAVLDAVGAPRAHVVGYSMGGWMATGFAARHPGRLRSLAIGGWDPVGGRPASATGAPMDFDVVLAAVRARLAELAAWIEPDAEPALRACWDALAELDGAEAALTACPAPVLLWVGADDPAHEPVKRLASRLRGAVLRAVPGDHAGAMTVHAAASIALLQDFLRQAERDAG